MRFTCEIDMDSDAFAADPRDALARSLRLIADEVANGRFEARLFDFNGNTVGKWKVEP